MIEIFLKNNGFFWLGLTLGLIITLGIGIYFIIRLKPRTVGTQKIPAEPPENQQKISLHNQQNLIELQNLARLTLPTLSDNEMDLSAISGEDLIATQLDLARAYIETGKAKAAAAILQEVILKGSKTQQDEAKALLQLG